MTVETTTVAAMIATTVVAALIATTVLVGVTVTAIATVIVPHAKSANQLLGKMMFSFQ
jgi:hypothetical protein